MLGLSTLACCGFLLRILLLLGNDDTPRRSIVDMGPCLAREGMNRDGQLFYLDVSLAWRFGMWFLVKNGDEMGTKWDGRKS